MRTSGAESPSTPSGVRAEPADFLQGLFDIRAKSVVVTGAASGLGFSISEALVRSGAIVAMVDVSRDRLVEAEGRLAGLGDVRTYVADVTDAEQLEAVIDDVIHVTGALDVVFANAGIAGGQGILQPAGAIDAFDRPTFDRVLAINLVGAVLTTRVAARHMKVQRRGKIILTASATALRTEPMASYAYVLAKSAVVGLVDQASVELTRYGVTINAIAPGPMRTNFTGGLPDERLDRILASTVGLGRVAEPDELQGVAVLLASSASDFMSGAVIAIDGGASVSRAPAPSVPSPDHG